MTCIDVKGGGKIFAFYTPYSKVLNQMLDFNLQSHVYTIIKMKLDEAVTYLNCKILYFMQNVRVFLNLMVS